MFRKKVDDTQLASPRYRGAVIIEVDGAIHNIHAVADRKYELAQKRDFNENNIYFFAPPPDLRPSNSSITGLPGTRFSDYELRFSLYITNIDFIRITLEILSRNDILCILAASNRIKNPVLKDHLFKAIDQLFGTNKSRAFFKQEHTQLIHKDTHSPYDMRRKILELTSCSHLADEHRLYVNEGLDEKNPVYICVNMDRGGDPYDYRQNEYLFHMLQLLTIPAIHRTLDTLHIPDEIKTQYKCGLLAHQLRQVEKLENRRSLADTISEENAGAILQHLEAVILHNKWDMSYGGGKKAENGHVVTKKMMQMLHVISEAHHGKKTYLQALEEVTTIANKAALTAGPAFIGSRYPTTGLFYKDVASLRGLLNVSVSASSSAAEAAAPATSAAIARTISHAKAQQIVADYERKRAIDTIGASEASKETVATLLDKRKSPIDHFQALQIYMLNPANARRRLYETVLEHYTLSHFLEPPAATIPAAAAASMDAASAAASPKR